MKSLNILVLSLVLCMALVCPVASAHRVIVQGYVNEIAVKAYYGGGGADPMAYADVTVYATIDGKEEPVPFITGETDEAGMYYFAPKKRVSEYRVVVEATGHRGDEWVNLTEGAGLTEAEQEEAEEEAKLPLKEVITGFGYLAGIAGIAMILAARKMNK